MDEKLAITKKKLKGEDGYKVFSVRLREETVQRLGEIARQTNRSRNELINKFLDFAMDHCEVVD